MPDVLLGGICSWIGVAIGFGLQIGWQEYQERIHKKAVSSVNHGKAVSLSRGRTLVFTNYDDCANIARQVLQSLEEKSQAKH